jgi:hypothetical protein
MDLGVGSFVFAQGLTLSLPLLKDPKYLSLPLLPKIVDSIRKTLPMLLLGVVRIILVKGSEYPVGDETRAEAVTHFESYRSTFLNMVHTGISFSHLPVCLPCKFSFTL